MDQIMHVVRTSQWLAAVEKTRRLSLGCIVLTLGQMSLIGGVVLSAKLLSGMTRHSKRRVPRVEHQQEAKKARRPNGLCRVVNQWVLPADQRMRTRATIQSRFYRLQSTRHVCDHNAR